MYTSQKEAWESGFNQVKEILVKSPYNDANSSEFNQLELLFNIGRDQIYGEWSIVGAQMAAYLILCANMDLEINTNEYLYKTIESSTADQVLANISEELAKLGFTIAYLSNSGSRLLRKYTSQPI